MQRVAWDLRYPAAQLAPPRAPGAEGLEELFGPPPSGHLVMPGKYTVTAAKRVGGVWSQLGAPQTFNVVTEGLLTLAAAERKELFEFQQKASRLQRAVSGATATANETRAKLATAKRALQETPAASEKLMDDVTALDKRLGEILKALSGDRSLAARQENQSPTINARVGTVAAATRMANAKPTQTQIGEYAIASQEFEVELKRLRALIEVDLPKLEKAMESVGAPWTPGRIPVWQDK
jgi:hypothetical protein